VTTAHAPATPAAMCALADDLEGPAGGERASRILMRSGTPIRLRRPVQVSLPITASIFFFRPSALKGLTT
jgi:hypothetical protein